MGTKIIGNKKLTDEKRVQEIEIVRGINLPDQYREFLLKYNGGYPEPDGFNFGDNEDGSSVDQFLGIDIGEHSNLENYLEMYKGRYPQNFFPIAHDPGGNLVLIGLSGSDLEKIYFWDHEFEADQHPPDMSNMQKIADNFQNFLDSLFEIDID